MRISPLGLLSIFTLLPAPPAQCLAIPVTDAAAFKTAMPKALPGDTLLLKDGPWSNATLVLQGRGEPGKPIVISAEHAGMAVFGGDSRIEFAGDWITMAGMKFSGLKSTREFIVFKDGSNHCRLTNSAIVNSDNVDQKWIHLDKGTFHRIDHCRFSGMDQAEQMIQFETYPDLPGDHLVDDCLFSDRAAGNGNGFETIRIGYSHQQNNLARVTFERNLFTRCNGENEIISNKATGNRFLRNTFRDNSGEMTCRHGDKAWIEGNFFLKQGRGIRLIGSDHVVINNYIAGMRTDGINIASGDGSGNGTSVTGYEAAHNAIIAFNTIVDCPLGIDYGSGYPVAAKNVTIANNAFLLPAGSVMKYSAKPDGMKYAGNIYEAKSAGVSDAGAGMAAKTLAMVKDANGIYRPHAGSPLQGAAEGSWDQVVRDMDGRTRPVAKSVGAFEPGGTANARPLAETDVGPYWMGNVTPPDPDNPSDAISPRAISSPRADRDSFRGADALGRVTRETR